MDCRTRVSISVPMIAKKKKKKFEQTQMKIEKNIQQINERNECAIVKKQTRFALAVVHSSLVAEAVHSCSIKRGETMRHLSK